MSWAVSQFEDMYVLKKLTLWDKDHTERMGNLPVDTLKSLYIDKSTDPG